MPFPLYILISIVVILINDIKISASTTKTPLTTAIQPLHEKIAAEILKIDNDLKKDEKQLKTDRLKLDEEKKLMQKYIKTDVIRLNVGGEIIMTTRETLTCVPKSILSIMFNGRWERKLKIDKNNNIFFDFNSILFRHLLDQLQLFNRNSLNIIYLPSDPSLVTPFKKMIRKLGLNKLLLLSEKNIVTFNVGGQIMTSRRRTVNKRSNPILDTIVSSSNTMRSYNKSDIYVDYNPKLFQHLINQLREGIPNKQSPLKPPSSRDNITFQIMLNDLNISQQLILSTEININTKWKQNGITVAGGNDNGSQLNQLNRPYGIYTDNADQSIYIADTLNHRIVQWKYGEKNGQVVAGGNGSGNRTDQLSYPIHVIIHETNDSIIICDYGNQRVVRWYRQNATNGQIIISDIACIGLAMDNNEDLYVTNSQKNEIRRWKTGETNGTIVAGGNGKGNHLNQLNEPTFIVVDEDASIYVSDSNNNRVMKWMKDATEGIVVAGGHGQGDSLTQFYYPVGLIVDHSENLYAVDHYNHRIMRWSKGSKEGSIVIGGNGRGQQPNQFNYARGLSFDEDGNLYVVDNENDRVQRFNIE